MAGAGEAWEGRMLHQASPSNDSSSCFLLGKIQRTDKPENSQFYLSSDFRRVLDFEAAPNLPATSGL